MRTSLLATFLVALSLLAGCGGGNNAAPPPSSVRITVSPATANISVLETQQFTATVMGTSNTAVTWSVVEQNGGSVDETGKYTPPLRAGGYHVRATAQADTTRNAQAMVNVSAPAPVFSSTPPTAAAEAALYSYEISATDPVGTAVSYAVTTAPSGAAVSGSTLTWTPTWAQSRIPDNFVVTATSAAGGSATQSWTVNPNGTIHGSIIDLYWNASGSTSLPYDLSGLQIAALVPQPDGSLQLLTGTGHPDGTFVIPNVPPGYYWLQAGWLYWTDTSSFDGGSDAAGRPWSPTVDTTASFNLSGLRPWESSDQLLIQSPNCGDSCTFGSDALASQPTVGSSTFADSEAVKIFDADAAKQDITYVTQRQPIPGLSPISYYSLVSGPSLVLNSLTVNAGGGTSFAGALANVNPQTIDLNIRGSAWVAKFQNVAPSAAAGDYFWAAVVPNPFVSDKNLVGPYYFFNLAGGGTPLLDWEGSQPLVDTEEGPAVFTNPFPSAWRLSTMVNYAAYVSLPMPDGRSVAFDILNWYGVGSVQIAGFAPLMSPVQNPLMNGASLFIAATSSTTAVTLSWTAPAGLTPYGYCVSVLQYDPAAVALNWTEQLLWTAETSLTTPAGVLTPGNTYVFLIAALADGRANMKTSPFRSGFPVAGAEVISAPLTIDSSATSPALIARQELSPRKFRPGRLRDLHALTTRHRQPNWRGRTLWFVRQTGGSTVQ